MLTSLSHFPLWSSSVGAVTGILGIQLRSGVGDTFIVDLVGYIYLAHSPFHIQLRC